MIILKTISALQSHLDKHKKDNKSTGFVPTMGALHAGHLSLIQRSQDVCDVSVVSIFVNPTQFNDPKDFEKYPVTLERDCLKLEQQQTSVLFLPSVREMYPDGFSKQPHFDLGFLEDTLEGSYRPGHFQGVCQVVNRLLEIVQPNQLFLGQKDFQQCKVIDRLIHLRNIDTQINVVATMREQDGLAMSSRNVRLNEQQRKSAVMIYQQLRLIAEKFGHQSSDKIINESTAALLEAGFSKVDYIAIVDATTLKPVSVRLPNQQAIALIAAFMGEIRLIDNLLLN